MLLVEAEPMILVLEQSKAVLSLSHRTTVIICSLTYIMYWILYLIKVCIPFMKEQLQKIHRCITRRHLLPRIKVSKLV